MYSLLLTHGRSLAPSLPLELSGAAPSLGLMVAVSLPLSRSSLLGSGAELLLRLTSCFAASPLSDSSIAQCQWEWCVSASSWLLGECSTASSLRSSVPVLVGPREPLPKVAAATEEGVSM